MDKIKSVLSSHSDKNATHGTSSTGTTGATTGSTGGVSNLNSGNATANETRTHESSGNHLLQKADPPASSHPHPTHATHLGQDDAANATHDHKHLAAVTHQTHHQHETEEVQRQRDIERHHHHVQHHVQPVHDTQHAEVQHHEQSHPVTHVQEKHVNTDEDKNLFAGLATKHKDEYQHAGKERQVIDKGEIVNETHKHHVHHVVQPIIKKDTHEHHVIHSTVPISQTTHEAPIVHQSVEHEPMHLKDFVAGGGDLKSNLTHETAGVLSTGECERSTEGPLDSLKDKLRLSDNKTA